MPATFSSAGRSTELRPDRRVSGRTVFELAASQTPTGGNDHILARDREVDDGNGVDKGDNVHGVEVINT